MDLQEAVFDEKAFREGLMTQKLKVAKLEEQNLEIPEICQDLKDNRTWFMSRLLKPRSLERNSRNIKGCHERLRVNRDGPTEELEKISKHDQKKTKPLLYTYVRCDDCELSFV